MTVPVNTTFVDGGTIVASLFLNRLQEIISGMALNAELSISGTQIILTCGSGDTACVVAISGKLRSAEANKSVNLSGQPNGTYGIWFVTTADDSDASFTMVASIGVPAGSHVRQAGSVAWNGSVLSALNVIVGFDKHSYMHASGGYDPLPAASVSYAMLATDITDRTFPPGSLMDFAANAAPTGWLLCDGTAISRATYAQLFAVVGTAYGAGDGSTTFNLPDTRGRMTVGKGTHADVDALGDSDGNATVSTRTPIHTHTIPAHGHSKGNLAIGTGGSHSHTCDSGGAHTHGNQSGGTSIFVGSGGNQDIHSGSDWLAGATLTSTASGSHGHTYQAASHSHPNGDWSGNAGPNANGDSNQSTAAQSAGQRLGFLTAQKIVKT